MAARNRISGRVFDFIVEAHGRSPSSRLKARWLNIRKLRMFKCFNYT